MSCVKYEYCCLLNSLKLKYTLFLSEGETPMVRLDYLFIYFIKLNGKMYISKGFFFNWIY